jgi:hypothetical protein
MFGVGHPHLKPEFLKKSWQPGRSEAAFIAEPRWVYATATKKNPWQLTFAFAPRPRPIQMPLDCSTMTLSPGRSLGERRLHLFHL